MLKLDVMTEEKNKSKRRKWIVLTVGVVLITLGLTIYFRYYYVYSEGTRVGILYKFSKKGNVYKTYEGEMILPGMKFQNKTKSGLSSNLFHFSVTDEALAKELMSLQGMEIELNYVQYNNGLPWRGDVYDGQDGQYVVDKLVKIKNESPNGYGL